MTYTFYEFFAGGGMVRAGLGPGWTCLFANDNDPQKAACYQENYGEDVLRCADIQTLTAADIPGQADLIWGSFPCQDMSVAGHRHGLTGTRSGLFLAFMAQVRGLAAVGRSPTILVLENVCGLLTSHHGQDFAAVCEAVAAVGYQHGTVLVDAKAFVPQSRQRVFLIAVRDGVTVPARLLDAAVNAEHAPTLLAQAHAGLPGKVQRQWVWWHLPHVPVVPGARRLQALLADAEEIAWHSAEKTAVLCQRLTPCSLRKVAQASRIGYPVVGIAYQTGRAKRTGIPGGMDVIIRFDGMVSSLTASGSVGSGNCPILFCIDGSSITTRYLTVRESARLMGLPEHYRLPPSRAQAFHLLGDGVVVPVVRYLAQHIFEPLLQHAAV